MKKESIIDGYNLLCRIEKLENFIQTLNKASSASICIGSVSAYSSYNGTREEWKYPVDENDISEIIFILNKKLEALNKQLEGM